MRQTNFFRVERSGGQWAITDPTEGGPAVLVDAAVVAATEIGRDYVEGFLVGVHGVNQADVEGAPQWALRAIGISAHLAGFAAPRGTRRVQLTQDGRIDRDIR
jgi:hypothetical protein